MSNRLPDPGLLALDWLGRGVFIGVGARRRTGPVYDIYLVE